MAIVGKGIGVQRDSICQVRPKSGESGRYGRDYCWQRGNLTRDHSLGIVPGRPAGSRRGGVVRIAAGCPKELRVHDASPHWYLNGYGISSDTLGR